MGRKGGRVDIIGTGRLPSRLCMLILCMLIPTMSEVPLLIHPRGISNPRGNWLTTELQTQHTLRRPERIEWWLYIFATS